MCQHCLNLSALADVYYVYLTRSGPLPLPLPEPEPEVPINPEHVCVLCCARAVLPLHFACCQQLKCFACYVRRPCACAERRFVFVHECYWQYERQRPRAHRLEIARRTINPAQVSVISSVYIHTSVYLRREVRAWMLCDALDPVMRIFEYEGLGKAHSEGVEVLDYDRTHPRRLVYAVLTNNKKH